MTQPARHVHPARRASLFAALGALLALVVGLLTASPAHAANYQYWGYYQLTNGTWTFAQKGPAETIPADGSVEGWRWAITEESGTPPRNPRVTPTFEQVCGSAATESDKKRVGVVLDYGRAVDGDGAATPPEAAAECAVVPTAATGAEVLAAVATVRNGDAGLVCGIDSYPASGCGGQVATLTAAQQATDTSVTLAPSATPQTLPPSSSTPGASTASPRETAGPLIAPAPAATTSSGVPVVVWVGLVILLLGVAALVWSALRRRRQNV
ncbi:MAG: SCO2322 family protein [Lapillicoccus sp.]